MALTGNKYLLIAGNMTLCLEICQIISLFKSFFDSDVIFGLESYRSVSVNRHNSKFGK